MLKIIYQQWVSLLLCQMHIGRFCSNWDPIFVHSVHQNFPHVIVVRVKVKHISNHTGEPFVGKFLYRKKKSSLYMR